MSLFKRRKRVVQPLPFFGICKGPRWFHVHVGGFPNWFQVRMNTIRAPYLIISREDNR